MTDTIMTQEITDAPAEPTNNTDPQSSDGEQAIVDETDTARAPVGKWKRLVAYGLLPAVALGLAVAAGYLKWQDGSARAATTAAVESLHAATDGTVAILSYKPDTVDEDLDAATGRLTGDFKDTYTSLIRDVVIPGAKQKQITAVATVPAAASVSASENHATVLVFVNQTTTIGADAPTNTASSVRVALDKVDGRWLISQFEPV